MKRITRWLLYIIISGIVPISLQAQIKLHRLPDSVYLEKFDDWFVIKPSIVNTSEALIAKTGNYNIVLEPNTNEIVRTYFNYQFISFYIDYVPHSLLTNTDDVQKGSTKISTLGGSINTRHWFADFNFSHTKGYYVQNTKDFRADWRDSDPYLQVPDLHVTSYDATIGYNTNSHLSLPASVSQTERQLKSAGAFLPKTVFRYYIVDDRTPTANSNEKSKNIQALFGAGYQYTFVLKSSVYLVGAFTPAFGYIHTSVQNKSASGVYRFTQRGPIYQWDGKFGLGYNSHRFFAGTYLTAVSAKYSQGLTSAENGNANLFFQLFVGFRIKAPKFISNSYNKIFK
ncbi:DUF4421 domain-containing protein [Pedobacter sp. MC2016-14]|uniref:DUF4421 family protein n=1 Tax=Pedobacter sp. MC2016-14 TaxID=2897327 RepID=UPI001E46B925|nr:DUF4421 family protein [Pedobacter sp. MC2016-14]MCD0488071.1 DUF4421 domain-containing protein [Pedobacter sp. MC2016-14]